MFDAVRNNPRVVQIFLGVITLPFAFWGVDAYVRNAGAGSDVASVGHSKITVQQFDQALRDRQDQLRQSLGAAFRPEMMNATEVRLSTLNTLIDQRLLMLEAEKKRLVTGDDVLRDTIGKIPVFQDNGKFSMARYEAVLKAQGLAQPQFEARMRQDITVQQVLGGVGEAGFVSATQAEAMLKLQLEERQFAEFRIAPEAFADKVTLDTAALQKYYDDNKPQFEVPEKVRVQYVVLSPEAVLAQTALTDKEVKGWYDEHKDRYQQPEERRASHILILTKAGEDKAKARSKAEEVLKEVNKAPAKFAELAKANSQDPGSAQNGGDLGFFVHSAMTKPFAEAVFKMKEGEISGLVETEYGFHIIKLTGVKAGHARPFDEVRGDIERELKQQAAARKFAEAAEAFNNTVYEQSDSLQPAADKFKLKIQDAGWVTKSSDPRALMALGPLGNEKLFAALFSEDAVKAKRNTEAVEVASNTLVAARVVEHVAASLKPFEQVRGEIEKRLRDREAARLAVADGEARLAALKKGEPDKIAWSAVKTTSRAQARGLPPAAVEAVFRADGAKLPAYAGALIGGGYAIYKVTKASVPEQVDAAKQKSLQAEYGSIIAQEDLSAYLNSLRKRYSVEINKAALEHHER